MAKFNAKSRGKVGKMGFKITPVKPIKRSAEMMDTFEGKLALLLLIMSLGALLSLTVYMVFSV